MNLTDVQTDQDYQLFLSAANSGNFQESADAFNRFINSERMFANPNARVAVILAVEDLRKNIDIHTRYGRIVATFHWYRNKIYLWVSLVAFLSLWGCIMLNAMY